MAVAVVAEAMAMMAEAVAMVAETLAVAMVAENGNSDDISGSRDNDSSHGDMSEAVAMVTWQRTWPW